MLEQMQVRMDDLAKQVGEGSLVAYMCIGTQLYHWICIKSLLMQQY
jgi:hypothetical protein